LLARIGERLAAVKISFFVSAYLLSAGLCCALAVTGQAHFIDLHVYRLGGYAVLHGLRLYRVRYVGLPFTYPPFAAVGFVALAALPWPVAFAFLTVASVAALPSLLYAALRLPSAAWDFDRPAAWRLAFAAGTAGLWLEPVRTALGYGQIDLLLAAAILFDLARPEGTFKGALIGLCAGLKLTPAIFILYLLLTRRFRAAATAMAAFAVTIGVGYLVVPASSVIFWDKTFVRPGRISPVQNAENQSLLGAIARTLHTPHVLAIWLPAAIIVAVAGLAAAARAQRQGNEALGFSVCAITGLLISPISWTHHWVIAIPALLLAAIWLCQRRAQLRRRWLISGTAALAATAVTGWLGIARRADGSRWLHLTTLGLAETDVYVVAGLSALAVAVTTTLVYGDFREAVRGAVRTAGRTGSAVGNASIGSGAWIAARPADRRDDDSAGRRRGGGRAQAARRPRGAGDHS
jgi:alpha-1,2-mannosyltransferase